MKVTGKKIIGSALILGTALLSTQSALADTPWYIYQTYNDNHANLKFSFFSDIDDNNLHNIAGSGSYAYNSSNYVQTTFVTDSSDSSVKLFWGTQNLSSESYYARTYHYRDGLNISSGDFTTDSIPAYYHSNLDHVAINLPKFSNLSTERQYETAAHEMGHVLGLHHDDYNTTSYPTIMMQYAFRDNRNPTWWDFSKIDTLYNGL